MVRVFYYDGTDGLCGISLGVRVGDESLLVDSV